MKQDRPTDRPTSQEPQTSRGNLHRKRPPRWPTATPPHRLDSIHLSAGLQRSTLPPHRRPSSPSAQIQRSSNTSGVFLFFRATDGLDDLSLPPAPSGRHQRLGRWPRLFQGSQGGPRPKSDGWGILLSEGIPTGRRETRDARLRLSGR